MAKHEFGIMPTPPQEGKRYDEYEPERYGCISVDDDYLEDIVCKFDSIDFYWHTTEVKGKGLAYCGITLIPPTSIGAFLRVIADIPRMSELKELSQRAYDENKWIIHFGL